MKMVHRDECGTGVPYGSLFATILLCTGVGFFTGASLVGISETQEMFDETSIQEDMETFLEALRYVIYGVAAVFAVYSLLLLFIGFVATGQAKKQVYIAKEITFSGKCCMNTATIFTYFMMLIWLFITFCFIIPTLFMKMTTEYCWSDGIIDENDIVTPNACINLTWYGLGDGGASNAVCDGALLTYCKQSKKSFVLFLVSFVASAIATLGMINFLMCLAANSGHLRDGMKRQDYERKRNMEEQELFHLTMNKSTERLATTPYF